MPKPVAPFGRYGKSLSESAAPPPVAERLKVDIALRAEGDGKGGLWALSAERGMFVISIFTVFRLCLDVKQNAWYSPLVAPANALRSAGLRALFGIGLGRRSKRQVAWGQHGVIDR